MGEEADVEEEGDGMLGLQEVVVVDIITVADMAVEEDDTAVAAEAIVTATGAVDAVVADRTAIEIPAATAQATSPQMLP